MVCGVVGSGPAADAVRAGLADVDAESVDLDPDDDLGKCALVVAVGRVGDGTLAAVNERALAADLPWIGVELGGVGGYPVVDAAVAGFSAATGCYDCLQGRVQANVDPDVEPTPALADHEARYAGALAGREAARYVADGDDRIFETYREVPAAERAFLPLPGCGCAEDDSDFELTHVERDLDESLALAERGLDERVGIVQQVGEVESFPAPYYLARVCDTAGFSDASAARDAAGVALDWDAAFMKALGEGFERYCAGVYREDDLVEATPVDRDGTVAPSEFVTAEDPPADGAIEWVEGWNLRTDEPAWLPAEFVHYPSPAERFRPPITTGLGLGNGGVGAVLAGLYEVIERDAAMLAWYSTYEPLGLSVDDDGFRTLAARAGSVDLEATPLLLTQDVDVPVVAVAVHREDWPRFALGSGAHLDANRAARSALAEALQNWTELEGAGREGADEASGAIGRYAEFPESVAGFVSPDSTVPAASVGPADVPTGEAELLEVLSRLDDRDLAAYAAPTTTRDVDRLGFEAVRVVVPSAQPLFFDEPYFGKRAETVPVDLGFEPALDREHHPFP